MAQAWESLQQLPRGSGQAKTWVRGQEERSVLNQELGLPSYSSVQSELEQRESPTVLVPQRVPGYLVESDQELTARTQVLDSEAERNYNRQARAATGVGMSVFVVPCMVTHLEAARKETPRRWQCNQTRGSGGLHLEVPVVQDSEVTAADSSEVQRSTLPQTGRVQLQY